MAFTNDFKAILMCSILNDTKIAKTANLLYQTLSNEVGDFLEKKYKLEMIPDFLRDGIKTYDTISVDFRALEHKLRYNSVLVDVKKNRIPEMKELQFSTAKIEVFDVDGELKQQGILIRETVDKLCELQTKYEALCNQLSDIIDTSNTITLFKNNFPKYVDYLKKSQEIDNLRLLRHKYYKTHCWASNNDEKDETQKKVNEIENQIQQLIGYKMETGYISVPNTVWGFH